MESQNNPVTVSFNNQEFNYEGNLENFNELQKFIEDKFPQLKNNLEKYQIQYQDSDGDQITISRDEDLQAMIEGSENQKIVLCVQPDSDFEQISDKQENEEKDSEKEDKAQQYEPQELYNSESKGIQCKSSCNSASIQTVSEVQNEQLNDEVKHLRNELAHITGQFEAQRKQFQEQKDSEIQKSMVLLSQKDKENLEEKEQLLQEIQQSKSIQASMQAEIAELQAELLNQCKQQDEYKNFGQSNQEIMEKKILDLNKELQRIKPEFERLKQQNDEERELKTKQITRLTQENGALLNLNQNLTEKNQEDERHIAKMMMELQELSKDRVQFEEKVNKKFQEKENNLLKENKNLVNQIKELKSEITKLDELSKQQQQQDQNKKKQRISVQRDLSMKEIRNIFQELQDEFIDKQTSKQLILQDFSQYVEDVLRQHVESNDPKVEQQKEQERLRKLVEDLESSLKKEKNERAALQLSEQERLTALISQFEQSQKLQGEEFSKKIDNLTQENQKLQEQFREQSFAVSSQIRGSQRSYSQSRQRDNILDEADLVQSIVDSGNQNQGKQGPVNDSSQFFQKEYERSLSEQKLNQEEGKQEEQEEQKQNQEDDEESRKKFEEELLQQLGADPKSDEQKIKEEEEKNAAQEKEELKRKQLEEIENYKKKLESDAAFLNEQERLEKERIEKEQLKKFMEESERVEREEMENRKLQQQKDEEYARKLQEKEQLEKFVQQFGAPTLKVCKQLSDILGGDYQQYVQFAKDKSKLSINDMIEQLISDKKIQQKYGIKLE